MNRNETGQTSTHVDPQDSPPDGLIREGTCPPEDLLRAAAFGEAETMTLDSLAEHLNRCEACVLRIESMLREDRLAAEYALDTHRRTDASADGETASVFVHSERTSWIGRYRLGKCLGQGGIGKVFEATDTSLGRVVAIKQLRLELLTPRSLDRFEREARSQATLNHPNIVALHEFGHHHGFPFLVMERIDGEPLSRRLNDRPLAPRTAAGLMIPVARAVAHAHHKGLVHRDLKPSNILLAAVDGSAPHDQHAVHIADDLAVIPKIADFGLARVFNDDENATRTEEFAGTVAFMAAELVSSQPQPASPSSDIYSLGVILYVCLTGRHPFQGQDIASTLAMIRDLDPVMPSLLVPGLPRDLETICMKCLEKQPARRYSSADDLADDLQRFLEYRPILARPAGLFARATRWCRRHPGMAAAVSVSVVSLVIMAIGGWVAAGRQAELLKSAQESELLARRQVSIAEQARQNESKRREIALAQFMRGTNSLHRFGMILEPNNRQFSDKDAIHELRRLNRAELVDLTDDFLKGSEDLGESPEILIQVMSIGAAAHAANGDLIRAEELFRKLEKCAERIESVPESFDKIRFFAMNAASAIGHWYFVSDRPEDTIRVLSGCLDRWKIDLHRSNVPNVIIGMRRNMALSLKMAMESVNQVPSAELETELAELDKRLAMSRKANP